MNKLFGILLALCGALLLATGGVIAASNEATVTVCNLLVNSASSGNFIFTNNVDNKIISLKGNVGNTAVCGDFIFDASLVSAVTITPKFSAGWVPVPAFCAVNIASGGQYQCDFKQTFHPAKLTVNIKSIGGDATFTPKFNPFPGISSVTTLNGVGSKTISITPGAYTTAFNVPAGWVLTANDCPVVNFVNNGVYVCNYEATKQASLIINQTVVNNSSTSKYFGDFTLRLNGNVVTPGIGTITAPGAYVLSVDPDPDFDYFISGDCAVDGSVVLSAGDKKVCNVVNKAKSFNFSFLNPYNPITKSFKKQGVIPVKVKITTVKNLSADKELPEVYVINPNGSKVKAFSLNTSFVGNVMRFNSTYQYFEYDLSTKLMTGPGSYQVEVRTSDGQVYVANIVN